MGKEFPGTHAGPRTTGRPMTTSPATRRIHCSRRGTQGMGPSSARPMTAVGQGVGGGVELFAQGVKLLGSYSVACAVRNSLTSVCNKIDSKRVVANGGVLIALHVEVNQIVAEPDFPPPPAVKGAHIVGYPPNPCAELRKHLNRSVLRSARHRNVNLEIYFIWVTPRMLIERNFMSWPVLGKQVIDLSGPSLIDRIFGPLCRRIDQMTADWARKRAAKKDSEAAARRARERAQGKPRQRVPAGGLTHTYNQ